MRAISRRELEVTVGVVEILLRAAGFSAITASEAGRGLVRWARFLQRAKALDITEAQDG